ncbi:hypothetical protein AB0D86_05915 [Streptomyces sp. NPDC048324]|uniref:hypothetical protein n=1 Tax=Streptomyces sp. NPDC048324 TaxID=3157205 RepID=UPI003426BA84
MTVQFHNGGGSPVTSGVVTFGTHILDAFGGDWKTMTQTRGLSAPVPAGATADRTWTLCVDSWRVPSGWHIDTPNVAATLNRLGAPRPQRSGRRWSTERQLGRPGGAISLRASNGRASDLDGNEEAPAEAGASSLPQVGTVLPA